MDSELREYLDQRFDAIDQRFVAVDRRIGSTNQPFDTVGPRVEALERKLDAFQAAMLQRLGEMAARLRAGYRVAGAELVKAINSVG